MGIRGTVVRIIRVIRVIRIRGTGMGLGIRVLDLLDVACPCIFEFDETEEVRSSRNGPDVITEPSRERFQTGTGTVRL